MSSGNQASLPWLASQAEAILPMLTALAPSPIFPRPAMVLPLPAVGSAPRQLTRMQVHRTPPRQLLQSLVSDAWPDQTRALLLLYNLDGKGQLSDALSATPFWLGYAFVPDHGQGELCLRLMFNVVTGTVQQRPSRTAFETRAGAVEA